MAKGNHKPGGGAKSRVNVSPSYRQGQPRQAVRVAGVNQRLGGKVGDHATQKGATGYKGEVIFPGRAGYPSRLGNELTKPNGPKGQGRTVYASGSQQGMQSAKPLSATRDTLAEFGPDSAQKQR